MAFRHPSRRNPVSSKADAYGDGGFFFTQPVGRPTGRVEPGSGRPDPNNSVTASVPFGQGGPFDNELVQTNAPYSRTTYGDGGYYFLSPVNTPNYSGVEGVVRQGMRHPQYGVAPLTVKLQTKDMKVKTVLTNAEARANAQARGSRSGSGQTETKQAEAVASAAKITDYQNALKSQGKAQFWVDFWGGGSTTRRGSETDSGRGMQFGGGSSSNTDAAKTDRTRAATALTTAKEAVYVARQNYLEGLPANVVSSVSFADALAKFEKTYIRKGWLDEAFLGVDSSGKRKVSTIAVEAIKRDVFKAYAERALSWEDALAMGKRYILATAQYAWPDPILNDGGFKGGATIFDDLFRTPYGRFEESAYSGQNGSWILTTSDGDQVPGRVLTDIRPRETTGSVGGSKEETSYKGGVLWHYDTGHTSATIKKYQQADRYWLIRGKILTDKALLSGTNSELGRTRTTQASERTSLDGSLMSIVSGLAGARKAAVDAQIGVERTELDKQKSARDAKTFREQTQSAAAGVKTEGVKATTKRGEAMAAGAAGDVAGATAKAGETDTFAKSADSKLANVRKLADSVKTANTASDNRAPSEITSAETAYRDAANYATQALVDATAAAGAPVVAYAMVASTKRAAAESAAIAGNEAAAATAAGEADTAAKAADSALGVVTAQGEAVAVSKGFSEAARALVTAAFDEAAKAEAQAKADAESATKQVEVARANKLLIDAKIVADAAVKEAQDAQKRAEEERVRLAQGQSTQAAVDEYQRQASAANDRASQATGAVNAAGAAVTETRAAAASARIPAEPEKLDLSSGRTSLIGKPGTKVKLGGTGMGEGLSTTVKVAIGVGVLAAAGGAYWWFKIRPKGVK